MPQRKYNAIILESRLRDLKPEEIMDFMKKIKCLDSDMNILPMDKPEDYAAFVKDRTRVESIALILLGNFEHVAMKSIDRLFSDWPYNIKIATFTYFGWYDSNQKANTIKEILDGIQSFKREYASKLQGYDLLPSGIPELQLP